MLLPAPFGPSSPSDALADAEVHAIKGNDGAVVLRQCLRLYQERHAESITAAAVRVLDKGIAWFPLELEAACRPYYSHE